MLKISKQGTSALIKKLWNTVWDLWEHRNGALHNSGQNRVDILEKDVNDMITEIYHTGSQEITSRCTWDALETIGVTTNITSYHQTTMARVCLNSHGTEKGT